MVSLYSCSSDDDNGSESGKVKLTTAFKYIKDGTAVNSPYTTMYLYDTKGEDTSLWEYTNNQSHNMKRPNGTVVYPKYTFLSDINGVINEEIENNTSYLYLAICGVDPARTLTDKFETKGSAIKLEKTLTAN